MISTIIADEIKHIQRSTSDRSAYFVAYQVRRLTKAFFGGKSSPSYRTITVRSLHTIPNVYLNKVWQASPSNPERN